MRHSLERIVRRHFAERIWQIAKDAPLIGPFVCLLLWLFPDAADE